MNLAHWLDRRAAATPEAPALFAGIRQVADYAAFAGQARAVAAWLRLRGVQPEDRVGLLMRNDPA